MYRKVLLTIVLTGCQLIWLTQAYAQVSKPQEGFFERNSAKDIFGPQVKLGNAPDIGYFPQQPKPKEEVVEAPQAGATGGAANKVKNNKNSKVSKVNTAIREAEGEDPVADELVEQYGDPTKNVPVKGVENAPAPFKGMMAALEANRDDIAMMYARQYVTYLNRLQATSERVAEMTKQIAVEGQGSVEVPNNVPVRNNSRNGAMQDEARAAAILEKAKANRQDSGDTEAFGGGQRINGQWDSGNSVEDRWFKNSRKQSLEDR